MSIKTQLTRTLARQVLLVKKESPALLFAGGIVAIGTSTVLACKATLRLPEVLEDAEKSKFIIDNAVGRQVTTGATYTEKEQRRDLILLKRDVAIKMTKLYFPAVAIGVVGIGMLAGAHHIQNQRYAALTAAYAGLQQLHEEYRRKVAGEIGEDKERKLHYETQKDMATRQSDSGEIKKHLDGDSSMYAALFCAENTLEFQNTPEVNKAFLLLQQNYANQQLNAKGYLFLNDVYKGLGLPTTRAGQCVGWVLTEDGSTDNYVDFGIFDGDSREYYSFIKNTRDGILLDFNVDGDILDRVSFKKKKR